MIPNNLYSNWKESKFLKDVDEKSIIFKINEFIKLLNAFYGLVGLSDPENEVIYIYIENYVRRYPMLKLIDLDRAIELYKKRPDLNKLCPEYFETIFEKYRKSDERKQIYKQWENDPTEHRNEVAQKTALTPEQIFTNCYNEWKATGNINLNTGAVYVDNYEKIVEALTLETMQEIKEQTQERLIKEHSDAIEKMDKNSSLKDEAVKILNDIKAGIGLLKRETRKAHLKRYFEILDFES